MILAIVAAAAGCDVNGALHRESEARRLSADLLVQFTKAADASNRAVMADTDDASAAAAREAAQSTEAIQTSVEALKPVLDALHFADEGRLLQEFVGELAQYRAVDRSILDLAVENTNIKAQRLSFGAAQEAADTFRDSLESVVVGTNPGKDQWEVKALIATAVAAVREMQVLQAPHIAEADDTAMTGLEKRMAAAETTARASLKTLAPLVQPASRPKLGAAGAALNTFVGLNSQILALSRRNTNVRALALALNQKTAIAGACDHSLHALRAALAKRGFTGTR